MKYQCECGCERVILYRTQLHAKLVILKMEIFKWMIFRLIVRMIVTPKKNIFALTVEKKFHKMFMIRLEGTDVGK